MLVKREYAAADVANWWINKLLKQEGTASAVDATGSRVIDSGLNPIRIYHSSRQVSCEALIPELYTGVNTASSSLALSTAASATNGQLERRTTSNFDSFGNVSQVSTEARNQATRTLSSNYSAWSGYFPETVTDALGKSTVSTFDLRFGKPLTITDPNGLVSSTTLDGLGREVKMVFPSATLSGVFNQMAPDKRVSYESCGGGVTCPVGTVMKVVSDQRGTPRQVAYMDSVGRTLRSAKAAFNSTNSTGGVVSWDVVLQKYSTRGLLSSTSEPRSNVHPCCKSRHNSRSVGRR
jgi:hypothetical protein